MFNQKNNWGEGQGPGFGKAAVAAVSGGRVGIFSARLTSTHRFKLPNDFGMAKGGSTVQLTVQSYHAQSDETRAAARWVCTHPSCAMGTYPTGHSPELARSKEELLSRHGEPGQMEKRQEVHCIMAISLLPEDIGEITGVMAPARGLNATTLITTREPHGLKMGDAVVILNVSGRPDASSSAHATEAVSASIRMAEMYEKFGEKAKAKKILDGIDLVALAKAGELLPLSVNGPALAHNTSALDFLIARELNGTFLLPEIMTDANTPKVILRPKRPIFLSDVE